MYRIVPTDKKLHSIASRSSLRPGRNRPEIDLFFDGTTHICYPQIAGQSVETETPVTQSQCPHLIYTGFANKGIVGRNGIGRPSIHINAQHFSEYAGGILCIAIGWSATITGAQPQVTIGTKVQVAAVVVIGRLICIYQESSLSGSARSGISGTHATNENMYRPVSV